MRLSLKTSLWAAGLMVLAVGCAGPEQKLGRGINNMTEFARMGDLRRSMEQTAVWRSPESAYATGFIQGMNQSFKRTLIGAYEVLTFPIPSYEPVSAKMAQPLFPDNYKPGLMADPLFGPDSSVGFRGGDVAPFIPGSRFRIFDY